MSETKDQWKLHDGRKKLYNSQVQLNSGAARVYQIQAPKGGEAHNVPKLHLAL